MNYLLLNNLNYIETLVIETARVDVSITEVTV